MTHPEPRLDLEVIEYAIKAHMGLLLTKQVENDDPLVRTLRAAASALASERDRADLAEVNRSSAIREAFEKAMLTAPNQEAFDHLQSCADRTQETTA